MRTIYTIAILLILALCLVGSRASAQGQIRAIQFTGLLTGGKDNEPLPQATVYIPKAGRGVLTNLDGFFTIPVYPGDTVEFRYVGYKKQYHVVPRINEQTYSLIVEMQEDATLLREVKVYPYPTEEEFKRAFLASRLTDEREREALAKNTDPAYLRQMAAQMGVGAAANYRYLLNQQTSYNNNKNFATTIPFLNPLAWASFIRSIKNGDLKRDDWKPASATMPNQNISREQYIRQQSKN